ncbi:piggyBac transposable element-derived protein 2-like [Watersipora subatra]|uniref:piggyBac transposable element-derived protein 2-like n=1 Tax=Watersipora subatra TaxID=2589382 RepID=UPI00355C7A84
MLSSLTGAHPVLEAERWDKQKKSYVKIPMPLVVGEYNKKMGGVDLLDSFLASFKFKMRSRRWHHYLLWHFMMVALINSWNVYRKDFQLLKLPKKEMLSRRQFQSYLASTLIKVNSQPKRGRPLNASSSPASPAQPQKKRRHAPTDYGVSELRQVFKLPGYLVSRVPSFYTATGWMRDPFSKSIHVGTGGPKVFHRLD